MKRAPKPHPTPGLPSVNLLSPSAFEQIAVRKLRGRFTAGALTLVLVVAGAWGVQHLRVQEAEQVLATEKTETTRLLGETQALAPVKAYVAGVELQKQTASDAMADEILYSRVLAGLERATPSSARLQSLGVTLAVPVEGADPATSAAGSACPGPDPFNTRKVVGCVTVSGTAASRAEVGAFVIALGDDGLFVEPFISTTTTADSAEVAFTGSVGLSPKAHSLRYRNLDRLLDVEVAP